MNDGRKPLPVLRLVFDDAERTLAYVDPASGMPLLAYGSAARAYRWLFSGLHSLAVPGLYLSRPLWDVVMLVLMVGGTALSVTGIWTGVVWLRRALTPRRARPRSTAA